MCILKKDLVFNLLLQNMGFQCNFQKNNRYGDCPAGSYIIKVNIRNTGTRCEICSK